MFKTLITTCLLTFSCASGTLKDVSQTKDLNVRNYYGVNNVLSGGYCFKPHIESLPDSDVLNEIYTFDLTNSDIVIYYYSSASNYFIESVTGSLSIEYVTGSDAFFKVNWYYDLEGTEYFVYYDYGFDLDETFDNTERFCIWFLKDYYCSNDMAYLFNYMFQNSPNDYCKVYNGWYTFSNTFSVNNIVGNYFNLYGNFTIDNNLYSQMSFNSTTHTIYASGTNGVDYFNFKVYDNSLLLNSNAIYINNCLMPYSYYQYLVNWGTFNYVPQQVEYTFGDMIFSVIDAPIYMLSQLFSFELFGIQFYVAFMGITTVLLIFFIVRKVI